MNTELLFLSFFSNDKSLRVVKNYRLFTVYHDFLYKSIFLVNWFDICCQHLLYMLIMYLDIMLKKVI